MTIRGFDNKTDKIQFRAREGTESFLKGLTIKYGYGSISETLRQVIRTMHVLMSSNIDILNHETQRKIVERFKNE